MDLSFPVCERVMAVNAMAHIAVTRAALPHMIERGDGQIVNVLSVSGFAGTPMRTMYVASKFGLSGFGKALRAEVKPHGVSVVQVYPGYVKTNISANAVVADGRSFGKLDSNIGKGMPVDQAVDHILRCMILNRTETTIGKQWYNIIPFVSAISNSLTEWGQDKYFSSQKLTKSQA